MCPYTVLKLLCPALFISGLNMQQYEEIRDNSLGVHHILFGDLTKMDDMFIEPSDYDDTGSVETKRPINKERKTNIEEIMESYNLPGAFIFRDLLKTVNNTGFDVVEFNKITKALLNETRRSYYFDDPEDTYHGQYLEAHKKKTLVDIALQFLIHTRYKLAGALKQKEPVRYDKSYRLGYLFNRLRRLKYEMAKLTDHASKQPHYPSLRNQITLMRIYEKVIRFDVDIKDTIELIKTIDVEPE